MQHYPYMYPYEINSQYDMYQKPASFQPQQINQNMMYQQNGQHPNYNMYQGGSFHQQPSPYPNPYPRPTPFVPPQQSGMQTIMSQFKKHDGQYDINKMMDTAGQMMSAMNQMGSLVKGVTSIFKV
ncbi:YppG family protein [Bacillus sp. IB182487]|uniref:YppG family protein n=2 Tax=Metabacillus arenae TaxID=2771434 RepID=A0A926NDU9_9BACI|nr:YppG family protein [Metabacillus arenae]